MKIAFRILITLFIVTTVSTGMIAFSVAYLGRSAIRNAVQTRQLDTAKQTMDKLDRFMFERTGDLQALAGRINVRAAADGTITDDNRVQIANDLARLPGVYQSWYRFAILDAAGDEVIASGEERPEENVFAEDDPIVQEVFRKAMAGEVGVSDVIFSNEVKGFTIVIMVPVMDAGGKVIGAVEGHVDHHQILEILEEVGGAELHLINRNGFEIGTSVRADIGEILVEDYSQVETYKQLMATQTGSAIMQSLHEDVMALIAHIHDSGYRTYPGLGWSLTLETPVAEAFADSDRTVIYSVLIAYLSGILGLLAIILIVTRSVVAPIERLTEVAKKITAGDLEAAIPSAGDDEVGELAFSFKEMTARLRASYRNLEDRVRQRTQDLERAKGDLEVRNASLEETRKAMANLLEDVERGRDAAIAERARFEVLLSSIGDGVLVTEPDGTLTYANSAASALTGFRIKDVLGLNLMQLAESVRLDGSIVPETERPLFKALRQGMLDTGEYLYRRADRSQFPASVTSAPVMIGGKIAGSITIFRDISKDIEEKRLIEEQKARYEALLSSVADGVIAVDKDGKVIFANEAVARLTGFTVEEIVGNRWDAIEVATDEKGIPVPKEKRTVTLAIQSGKPQYATFYYRRKDKTMFPVSTATSPVLVGGKLVAAVSVFRDITKETQVDKAKSEFVSLASHQLKTPLAAVRWYLELVLGGEAGKLSKVQKEYLGEIKESIEHMNGLVNALLNVSRIELGTFTIDPEPSDVCELADVAASELMPQIKQKKLTFEKSYEKGLPTVPVDRSLMNIIVQNMLSNAVKYTPEGGKIGISVSHVADEIVIDVKDTGMGITKSQQARIFGRMFRADNAISSQTEGTGLGLYLVKSILDNAGGRIWFESEEGKGTVFHVAIPVTGMVRKEGTRKLT